MPDDKSKFEDMELQVFAMVVVADGDATLARDGQDPQFYDVLLSHTNEKTGEVEVISEVEDLSATEVMNVVEKFEKETGLIAEWVGG